MRYFTIKELTKSTTATRLGIDNEPNEQEKQNIAELIENVLDPLRKAYGEPIKVNSGFRCEELNKKVGGVSNSHHLCKGKYAAADITGRSIEENKKIFALAKELDLPLCQCIFEKGGAWIHISHNSDDIRKQYLYL